MNKRQRKKNYKKFRTEQILKKKLAIIETVTQGALSATKVLAETGSVELAEAVMETAKVYAGLIAATPIKSQFKTGGIVPLNTGGEIITLNTPK